MGDDLQASAERPGHEKAPITYWGFWASYPLAIASLFLGLHHSDPLARLGLVCIALFFVANGVALMLNVRSAAQRSFAYAQAKDKTTVARYPQWAWRLYGAAMIVGGLAMMGRAIAG